MITIPIDTNNKQPIYLQIYNYIKQEILKGHLKAQEKLPSARALAANLEVSRSTIDTAYQQLVAEGYVDAKQKRGYFVVPITHLQQFSSHRPGKSLSHINRESKEIIPFDFNPNAIDTQHFPYSIWKSLGKNHLDNPDNFVSGLHYGEYALRQAISDYLHGSRGVSCSPENIIVGAGLDHLLSMLCILFDRHTMIAMENPGYRSARQVLQANDYSILDIPLKNDSMDLSILSHSQADLCYVTPSHQFPMGTVMPISQRQELLSWANDRPDRYIIEDDHDSEFRYKGKPIPALQSLDTADKVIYLGTFSKSISPAIRTGYMVLPDSLIEQYNIKCGNYACPVSRLTQALLTDFIHEGYFEKHLNRMRKLYKTKHDHMLQAVQDYFSTGMVEISGDHAGLYIILCYTGSLTEEEICKRAKENGIRLHSLKKYYASLPADYQPTFLLGFANLSNKMIDEGIRLLAQQVFA